MNEFRDFIHYAITKYTIGLYLFSGFIFLGAVLVPGGWISNLFTVLGTGIAVTTLVSSTLNFYFERGIHRHFSIVSGAEKSGVHGLYPTRANALCEINAEFKRARGAAALLSIAGTDLFHTACPIIGELDKWCTGKQGNEVRILLLDPRSKHAIDRALLEEGIDLSKQPIEEFNYLGTALWKNIIFSLEQLERLLDVCTKTGFGLQVRTYDTAPMLLYVQVNGRAFVEQYHYGTTREERQTPLTKCLGKKVTVSEYRIDSLPGRLYGGDFDYLWETSKRRIVSPGFSQKIVQQEIAWREIYLATASASEKWLAGGNAEKSGSQATGELP